MPGDVVRGIFRKGEDIMKSLELVMLRGSSGAVYPFQAHPLDTKLENIGAVYALTKRKPDASGRNYHSIIYIGQTKGLAEAVSRHRSTPWLRQHAGNCVCLYIEKDEKHRSQMELDLSRYYSPRVAPVNIEYESSNKEEACGERQ